MNQTWSEDKRLNTMSTEKINFLKEFSTKLASSSKDNMAAAYLSMNMAAKNNKIHFTDQETELLLTIFSEGMTKEERQRIESLKILIKKLAVQNH